MVESIARFWPQQQRQELPLSTAKIMTIIQKWQEDQQSRRQHHQSNNQPTLQTKKFPAIAEMLRHTSAKVHNIGHTNFNENAIGTCKQISSKNRGGHGGNCKPAQNTNQKDEKRVAYQTVAKNYDIVRSRNFKNKTKKYQGMRKHPSGIREGSSQEKHRKER